MISVHSGAEKADRHVVQACVSSNHQLLLSEKEVLNGLAPKISGCVRLLESDLGERQAVCRSLMAVLPTLHCTSSEKLWLHPSSLWPCLTRPYEFVTSKATKHQRISRWVGRQIFQGTKKMGWVSQLSGSFWLVLIILGRLIWVQSL